MAVAKLCVICRTDQIFVMHLGEPVGWVCAEDAAQMGNPLAIELLTYQRTMDVILDALTKPTQPLQLNP